MSMQEKINKALLEKQKQGLEREKSHKFLPSSLGKCYRCQIINRTEIKITNPPDIRTLRIFKAGQLFHDFVQNFLPEHQTEVPCETKDFKGRADIVTEDTVYDIKSVHSYWFHHANKKDYNIKTAMYPAWLQVCFYAWVLKKKKICIVKISKDDLCIGEYVDFTERWRGELEKEINILKMAWGDYITLNALPTASPRAYIDKNGVSKECNYCNYLNWCRETEHNANRRHFTDKPE